MTMPQKAERFGSHARKPAAVTNDMRMFDLHAFSHRRRSIDASRHRPRRMSSREMAMTIPLRSSGIFRCSAYATARALPSRDNRALSDPGCSWMPLCSTPLLRALVSWPGRSCRSSTMMRRGRGHRRLPNSLAMAQPTTPAPTMQTSYVFMASGSLSSSMKNIRVKESRHAR